MRYLIISIAILIFAMSGLSEGAGRRISEMGNKHNFSYQNISVNYRALPIDPSPFVRDGYGLPGQICVFCHTPHRSSSEGPLWNRKASAVSFFKHYSSSTLAINDPLVKGATGYGQPNGSSRLCLSCHDGVTALGAVFTSPNSMTTYNMHFTDVKGGRSGQNIALTYETFSTHHPVSFNYNAARTILNGAPYNRSEYWWSPTSNDVKLDSKGRMQCTTCHDPHQDKSNVPGPGTPFWTAKTYAEVCLTCHNIVRPYPW
jgi:hypothetical protein